MTPLVSLGEGDALSLAPTYHPPDGTLASDVSAFETMAVGLPPRVVDPALLQGMKQARVHASCMLGSTRRAGWRGRCGGGVWPVVCVCARRGCMPRAMQRNRPTSSPPPCAHAQLITHSGGVLPAVLLLDMGALLMYNVAGMCVTGHLGAVFR